MSARARTATQRKQDHRERERRGEYLVACRVGLDIVDLLLDQGYLQMHESENRTRVAEAYAQGVEDMADAHAR